MSAGIDYGNGLTNIDVDTGIRFGVISVHDVAQAWADYSEPDYGKPSCPKCGSALRGATENVGDFEQYGHGCADYACDACEITVDSADAYPEEALGWNYFGEGYDLTNCLDSAIMVLKSDYYTFANFCSPCVPGAGDLNSANEAGAKTYCLGHDWFEEKKAPYPVYSVATGEIVQPA